MTNKTNEAMIAALNSLITINNDRYEGYTTAAKESKDMDLDKQFFESAGKSKMYAGKLAQYVRELGGEPTEGTTNSGKLYRIWMDVKAAIVAKDRAAILSSCEFGEEQKVRKCFQLLKKIQRQLLQNQINAEELSMGMSGDLEIAIEEGSTIIRVGTAIFGKRPHPDSYYWNEKISH